MDDLFINFDRAGYLKTNKNINGISSLNVV